MEERGRGSAGAGAGGRAGGRRTDYGVIVTNLPRGCSWQDLKDFMRKSGDVVYTDVDRYGEGVVEFSNRDDMENAIRTLDDTEFRNYNDSSYIRVKPANKRRDRSNDRDGSRGRGGSRDDRSRSRDRKRSPSRSRSPSPRRDRSRSRSPSPRSRSASPRDEQERSRSPERDATRDSDAAAEEAPAEEVQA